MLRTTKIEYSYEGVVFEGYGVFNDNAPSKKPAVLVVHDYSGRNDFACQKAEELADLGYVGFAIDMYGRGVLGKTVEEKTALMTPLLEDRNLLRGRILAAFEAIQTLEVVNPARIGVIGFCFGGLCALDLARSGAEVRGVVSFHGLLNAPHNVEEKKIHAKVLVMNGHDDPMVPESQVSAFQKEMTDAKVDWQLHTFGNVMHGFTNPSAHDAKSGIVYDSLAAKRSWLAMKDFFNEIFTS